MKRNFTFRIMDSNKKTISSINNNNVDNNKNNNNKNSTSDNKGTRISKSNNSRASRNVCYIPFCRGIGKKPYVG